MHRLVRCLVILSLVFSSQLGRPLVVKGERGLVLDGVSIKDRQGEQIVLYKESHALIIGNSNYTSGWPGLPGVQKDMQEVKAALESNGFKVEVKMDLDKSALEETFNEFITRYGQEPENRLLFYFAGHGHTVKMSYGEEIGYIVPVDAPNPNYDLPDFQSKAIDMQRVEYYAKRIQSKHALFLFDACFSGSLFALSRAVPEIISYKTANPVRQFVTSGSADETVPDESIFRAQFVRALQGEADSNQDGYLTGSELGEFLQGTVVNYSRNAQHPQYGKIRNPHLDKGDFVFLLPSRKEERTPVAAETPPEFSLEDLETQADYLRKMEEAFSKVNEYDQQDNPVELKIKAWERFVQSFSQDNPNTSRDDELRSAAQAKIDSLKESPLPAPTKPTQPMRTAKVIELLPDGTEFMLKFRSLETLYKHFSLSGNGVFGKPVENIEEIQGVLGFNPLNMAELKANGVDTSREAGVVIADFILEKSSDEPTASMLLFIPVEDGHNVIEKIKAMIYRVSANATFTQEGDLTIFEDPSSDVKAYMVLKGGYVFIAFNQKGDARPLIQAVIAGQSSLSEVKVYNDVISKVDSGEEVLVYLNVGRVVRENLPVMREKAREESAAGGGQASNLETIFNYISEYQGAGLSLDLESADFVLKAVVNLTSGSITSNIWKGIKFDKDILLGFRKDPVFLASLGVNVSELYKQFVSILGHDDRENLKNQLDTIKTEIGIDIERDILENIAGNLNFGIYDGRTISVINYNTLLTMTIKDETLLKNAIDKSITLLPPEQQSLITKQKIANVDSYIVKTGKGQLHVGIKKNTVIVTVGKLMLITALRGNIRSGFIARMKDEELTRLLRGDTNSIYLNINELLKAYTNFQKLIPGSVAVHQVVQETLSQFEYILISTKLEGTSMLGKAVISTTFSEPFFIKAAELTTSLQQRIRELQEEKQ